MFTFKTEKKIAEISRGETRAKLLTLTSWNGQPARLDLRIWKTDTDEPQPLKGITLNDEEAEILADALKAYLSAGEGGQG